MALWLLNRKALLLWLTLSTGVAAWLTVVLRTGEDKTVFLPGTTTDGHHQIETKCSACHTAEKQPNIFTSSGVPNSACIACHGDDLESASDSHPARKFKNPENAVFVQHIDALNCITCHREHNEKMTHEMGVTIPADYCAHCHEVTKENLASHADLSFLSCATAGCHNYHDNVALAPSSLLKHFGEADHLKTQNVLETDALQRWLDAGNKLRKPLTLADADAPAKKAGDLEISNSWSHSTHAAAGVNCSDCHSDTSGPSDWIDAPDHNSCSKCHDSEVADFLKGKHGMRLAHAGLSPMTPAMARLEMKPAAAHENLSCSSCHDSHQPDRKLAAFSSCVACHNDPHTKNYEKSAHYKLWISEMKGEISAGSGVSCATCHMPREERGGEVVVNHNQNANLRPNDKMLSSVCMNCHGMQFSMDALSDKTLIEKNFTREPTLRHPGLRWTAESAARRKDKRIQEILNALSTDADGDPIDEITFPRTPKNKTNE